MRKHGLKVLGLALVAAIGLMAFSASSALAVSLNLGDEFYAGEKGEFLVNSGTLSPTGLTSRAIKAKQIGSSRLLIPNKSAEIVCAKGEVTTGLVANEYENFKPPGMEVGGHGSATAVFKECKTEEINPATGALTGKPLTNCVPDSNATPGEIEVNFLILVKRHEGVTYLLFVPKVTSKATAELNEQLTSAFTTILFGELCSIPTCKVTGSLAAKAPAADAVKPKLQINTFSAAGKTEQALIGTKLKCGASEAFVEAEWEAELPSNPGVPWGAM